MTAPPGTVSNNGQTIPADRDLPLSEVLALSDEGLALFDSQKMLIAANSPFSRIFSAMPEFARPTTPWEIFLTEAQRRGLFAAEICNQLRLIEADLLDSSKTVPSVEVSFQPGKAYKTQLRRTSNGGFALSMNETVAEEDLAETAAQVELLMSKVLEACPASLVMARIGDGQILYRSPAASQLLGTTRNSKNHFARRAQRADFVTALLPDARVDDMRILGSRPDGSEFPASISARLIDYRGEEVVVSNIIDLSDEIAIQAELERQKDLNFQSEKMSALGELLAGVAHELNNPLSIVVGNALILKEEALEPFAVKRIEKLSDAAERCVRIVRTFLSMVREQPLELMPVSASDIVDTTLEAFNAGDRAEGISLNISVDEKAAELSVDEVQLVQVLLNLLQNAEQAMADAGQGDRIDLSVEAHDPDGGVLISVSDNGPGIPSDIRSRIFDPLFTTKSAGTGTGVGLAFCHRVLNAHKGSIRLDPDSKAGARFELWIPGPR